MTAEVFQSHATASGSHTFDIHRRDDEIWVTAFEKTHPNTAKPALAAVERNTPADADVRAVVNEVFPELSAEEREDVAAIISGMAAGKSS